jgi:hypothetical protein
LDRSVFVSNVEKKVIVGFSDWPDCSPFQLSLSLTLQGILPHRASPTNRLETLAAKTLVLVVISHFLLFSCLLGVNQTERY